MRNRAFALGVINGALVMVVASMVRPDLVLSAFVLRLTSSTFLAALPTALMHLGGLWPQPIVAHIAEGLPRKKPIYIISNASRILTLTAMALTAYLLGGLVADLISFQAAFALACLAGTATLALTVKLKEPRETDAAA